IGVVPPPPLGAEAPHLREEWVHIDQRQTSSGGKLGQPAYTADVQEQIGFAQHLFYVFPGAARNRARVSVDVIYGDVHSTPGEQRFHTTYSFARIVGIRTPRRVVAREGPTALLKVGDPVPQEVQPEQVIEEGEHIPGHRVAHHVAADDDRCHR